MINNNVSGLLYLDFYTSDKKRSPPCNHVIRSRTNKQLPVSVIECNYTPGNGYRPPHLNISTFEKLFRELGSAIHIMLGWWSYLLCLKPKNPVLISHFMFAGTNFTELIVSNSSYIVVQK